MARLSYHTNLHHPNVAVASLPLSICIAHSINIEIYTMSCLLHFVLTHTVTVLVNARRDAGVLWPVLSCIRACVLLLQTYLLQTYLLQTYLPSVGHRFELLGGSEMEWTLNTTLKSSSNTPGLRCVAENFMIFVRFLLKRLQMCIVGRLSSVM